MSNTINVFDRDKLLKILEEDMVVIQNIMAECNLLMQNKYIEVEEKEELIFSKGELNKSFNILLKYSQKKIDREIIKNLKEDFNEDCSLFEKLIMKIDKRVTEVEISKIEKNKKNEYGKFIEKIQTESKLKRNKNGL